MSTQLAEPPAQSKAITPAPIPLSRFGMQLRTLEEVFRFGTCLVKSGLAPKGMQTPEAITIAVQMGMEIGLPPMASVQNIAAINGRPSLWGDAMLGVVRATGELEEFEEWFEQGEKRLSRNPTEYADTTAAVCRVKREGYTAKEYSFSVADAKRANLWGKEGPWKQTPFRMLQMRARSFNLRDQFGDALRGLLSTEEVQDLPPKEAIGRVVEPARPALFQARNGTGDAAPVPEFPTNSPPADPASATLGGTADGGEAGATLPRATEPATDAAQTAASHGNGAGEPAGAKAATKRGTRTAAQPRDTLTLDNALEETAKERLERRLNEYGLDRFLVGEWLDGQSLGAYDTLLEHEAQDVLTRFAELKAFATAEVAR